MTFYLPSTPGEWLAFASAVVTIALGLLCLLFPRTTFLMLRLQTRPGSPEAVSESRATMAGFYLGVGVSAILLAQPLVYLALAAGWAFTALGRALSVIVDRGGTRFNAFSIALEVVLALAAALYPLGWL